MSVEYEWSKLREIQLNQEMDAIASSSTAKIVEYKLDEQLAAQYTSKPKSIKPPKRRPSRTELK